MIQVDPTDRISGSTERKSPVIWIALAGVLALGAGYLFWHHSANRNDFGAVYSQLGIKHLPTSLERQLGKELEQLGRESCYTEAALRLAERLLEAGFPREAGTSLRTFASRCGNAISVLPTAYEAFERVNDYTSALEIADNLVNAAPSSGRARTWRAISYERTGNFARALADYTSSIELIGPRNVAFEYFSKLSQMYAALGRHCDAITPIELYISLNPATRRNSQTTRIISEYAAKGKCDARHASGTARVPFADAHNTRDLTVIVNGITGTLMYDPGATFVSISPQFAAKARIAVDPKNQVTVQTANGITNVDLGYADSVAVGKAEAKGVVVAVHRGTDNPFVPVDGLLGMSFLSRFVHTNLPDAIEFKAIPLR